jgi:hypothetical protein
MQYSNPFTEWDIQECVPPEDWFQHVLYGMDSLLKLISGHENASAVSVEKSLNIYMYRRNQFLYLAAVLPIYT